MRIVQIVESLELGGLERLAVDLACEAQRNGHSSSICCVSHAGPLAAEAAGHGIEVCSLDKPPGFSPAAVWRLARELRRCRAQIVHTHNTVIHHYGAAAARLAGIPAVICTLHGLSVLDPSARQRALVRAAVPWTSQFVAVSEETRRLYSQRFHIPASKMLTIPNGIPVEKFRVGRRPEIDPGRVGIRFGTVGRLSGIKDHATLIRAFACLAGDLPGSELLIAGDGPLKKELAALVRSLGLDHRVWLCGATREVTRFLGSIDVFVLSSISEGLPVVILEAMAAGLPIVSTRVGGICEAAPEGEVAFYCEPGNAEQLAGRMMEAARSPRLAAMGCRAAEIAASRFSMRSMWSRYEALFAETSGSETTKHGGQQRREPEEFPQDGSRPRTGGKIQRIAIVTPVFPSSLDPNRGPYIYRIALGLQRFAEVRVFCLLARLPRLLPGDGSARSASFVAPPGVAVDYIEYPAIPGLSRLLNGATCARFLRPALEGYKPDLLLAYWIYPEGCGALRVASERGIPAILGPLGSDLNDARGLQARIVRRTLRQAPAIVTVSEDMRRRVISHGVEPERVTTILNGCDRAVFRPLNREAMRQRFSIAAGARLILFVGWLRAGKGIRELLEAFTPLAAADSSVQLALIGSGFLESELKAQVAARGWSDKVRFLGYQPPAEIAAWLAASDLLCLPSYAEGCPNAVIEALACGRPVVASNVGGVPELVSEQCGILVPPRDSAALAAALRQALARPWDEQAIAASFDRSWDDVARETFEVELRLAQSAARSATAR